MSAEYATLKSVYESAGQGHVFTFYDELSEDQKSAFLNQLQQIDPLRVSRIAKEVLTASPTSTSDEIEPVPASASDSVIEADAEVVSKWRNKGLSLIKDGKVGVVLLAGGQGTRLGSSDPKGCYDINLPSHKSLFQIQAERIKKISQLAGAPADSIPWYIMTSAATKEPTKDFFAKHNYFGLSQDSILFFEQGVMPCLTNEGKIILDAKDRVSVSPDGNGGIYLALSKSGVLDDMEKRGIQHVHTYCVDNCLVKVADPVFIGYAALKNVDIATKVVRKRSPEELVGLIVSKNSKPGVVEYSEISPEMARKTEDSDPSLLKFRAANIVNHYYSARFLIDNKKSNAELPFHVAKKKIPYTDLQSGDYHKPTSPNGIKLEQFVFDVFPHLTFDKFASLEVLRSEEFSPLKNGPGAKEDCPETSRADVLQQCKRWLEAAGATVTGDVEVSPATSYGGEGLESFKGKTVTESII